MTQAIADAAVVMLMSIIQVARKKSTLVDIEHDIRDASETLFHHEGAPPRNSMEGA